MKKTIKNTMITIKISEKISLYTVKKVYHTLKIIRLKINMRMIPKDSMIT